MIDRKDDNFGKRMIPEPDLNYLKQTIKNHPDPTASWGDAALQAGTGITIQSDTVSIDNTVALKSELFSGNYDDLTNKPTIGNGIITIQVNGTDVDSFGVNRSNNKTVNIPIPTNEPYIINTRTLDPSYDTISQEDWEYMLAHPDNVIVFRGTQRELYKYGFDSRVRTPELPTYLRFYNIAANTDGSRATLEFRGAGQGNTTWSRTYLDIFTILNTSSHPTAAGTYVLKCIVEPEQGGGVMVTYQWVLES